MKMTQVTMVYIVAGEATQLIIILINEATWRDAMQGRLYTSKHAYKSITY